MRTFCALALASALLAIAAATANAQPPVAYVNPYFNCGSGQVTRPAGSEIVLRFGWAAATRGLVQDFVRAETTSLSIDGAAVADADDDRYLTPIESWQGPDGTNGAVVRWFYPIGIVLAPGESFSFVYDSAVRHPLHDGIVRDTDGHGFLMGDPGSIFGGPIACTVTGA